MQITDGSLNRHVICGSTPSQYGWTGGWNPTTVPHRTYEAGRGMPNWDL
jgi:hypothetical protein